MNKINKFLENNKYTGTAFSFFKRLFHRIGDSNFKQASSFLSYHLLLSFIPMIIFLSQVLGFVNASFNDQIYKSLDYLPSNIESILKPLIENMISVNSTGLSFLAAFSWIWLGSRGFEGLLETINNIFDTNKHLNFILNKLVAILYMILFVLILIMLLVLNVFNRKILVFLNSFTEVKSLSPKIFNLLISGFSSVTPFIILTIMFFLFFKFVPATDKDKKVSFKAAFLGGLTTGAGIVITTLIYTFTNDNTSNLNLYYGSLAGILALLIWLLAICQCIVFGAQVAATIIEFDKQKKARKSLGFLP